MDTTYYSNIPVETLSLLDCDVKNFNFIHPIKNIFFDNIEYIRKLDASGKTLPCSAWRGGSVPWHSSSFGPE